MDIRLMSEIALNLVSAIPETCLLAGISLCIGLACGCGLAFMRFAPSVAARKFAYAYTYVFRATPLLVQMFLIYYGSGQFRDVLSVIGLWTWFKDPWFCAILALSLNSSAYTAEIVRGGILSVPSGQIDTAHALGLSRTMTALHVILPLALRQALPAYGNEIILMIKATSLASTITIMEITGAAKKIVAETWSPLEVFVVAGAIYLLINMLVIQCVRVAEAKLPASPGGVLDGQVEMIGR